MVEPGEWGSRVTTELRGVGARSARLHGGSYVMEGAIWSVELYGVRSYMELRSYVNIELREY